MQPQQPQGPTMPIMPAKDSKRSLIAAIILGVLLIASLIFGYSTYHSRQDYKNNSDKKVAAAVAAAKVSATASQKATDDQAAKAPYKTFSGPATYGSITFNYPKTWSAYVDQTSSDEPLNGYFHPGIVPGIQSGTPFGLRLELVSTAYSDVIDNFQSQVSQGNLTAVAYMPPKMKNVANAQPGTMFSGLINGPNSGNGTMLVIKVRDKTLQIYTDSNASFSSDFNNIILPSLSFTP